MGDFTKILQKLSQDVVNSTANQAATAAQAATQSLGATSAAGRLVTRPKEVEPSKLADLDPVAYTTFKANFYRCTLLNEWTETRAVLRLQTCLEGAAARAVEHIKFSDITTLQEAIDLYDEIFISKATVALYRAQFRTTERESGETLLLFHTRLREVFIRGHPKVKNIENNFDLNERFTVGLKNIQLSRALRGDTNWDEMTYTELLQRATQLTATDMMVRRAYEGTSGGKKSLNALGPSMELDSTPAKEDQVSSLFSPQSRGRGKQRGRGRGGPSFRHNQGPRCYQCQDPGHYVQDCPQMKSAKDRLLRNPGMFGVSVSSGNTGTTQPNHRGYSRGRSSYRGNRGQRGNRGGYTSGRPYSLNALEAGRAPDDSDKRDSENDISYYPLTPDSEEGN